MIALVLLYFVGKAFYDLAGLHNKSQWGFAILGVVSYYAGIFFAGVVMAIISELGIISLESTPEFVLNLAALPVGVLSCWGTYTILKNQWSRKTPKVNSEDVLDSDLIN